MRELVYGCRCTYLCACMHSYFYAYMTVSMCVRTYVLINVSLNVCISSRTDKYMYALIYDCVSEFTCLHLPIYMCLCVSISHTLHMCVEVFMYVSAFTRFEMFSTSFCEGSCYSHNTIQVSRPTPPLFSIFHNIKTLRFHLSAPHFFVVFYI